MPNASKIKILHLTHTYIPSDNRILKEMDALSEDVNFELHGFGICTSSIHRESIEHGTPFVSSLSIRSRFFYWLPNPARLLVVAIEIFLRFFIRASKLRPHVVHCHDTPILMVGVLLKCLFNCKLIYDAHELESNKNAQSRFISRLTILVERLAWPLIDVFISVSPSILDWYKNQLGPKQSHLILNSPVYSNDFSKSSNFENNPRYFHETYSIPAGAKVFLYLGLLVPGRGIEQMLAAFCSDNVSSHLVFVGCGSMEKLIHVATVEFDNIHLHPPVKHDEVVFLSRSADFGLCLIENVSLSDYFCLPNKLFEYAMAGIPVLASDFPDISKLVSDYGLGKCCGVNVADIKSAIHAIEDGEFFSASHDLQQISWQAQSSRLKLAYLSLL